MILAEQYYHINVTRLSLHLLSSYILHSSALPVTPKEVTLRYNRRDVAQQPILEEPQPNDLVSTGHSYGCLFGDSMCTIIILLLTIMYSRDIRARY